MKTRCLRFPIALFAAALATTMISAQTGTPAPSMRGDGPAPASKPFNVTRSDPGLDAVVAADATSELLATGFGLNEGPVWVRDGQSGYLLVGGLLDNVIYKVAADKTVSVFMEKAGYTGTDVNHTGTQTRSGRSHVLLIGPSCASLDSQGRLIWCADNDRAVMRLEKDGTTYQGELGGQYNDWASIKTRTLAKIESGEWLLIGQLTDKPLLNLPQQNAPLILNYAKTQEQRDLLRAGIIVPNQFTRPYFLPPGVHAHRVAALRDAFTKTLADSEFLAEAEKAKLDINPSSAGELQKLIIDYLSMPGDLKRKLVKVLPKT